jgi:hypothetical protein
MRFSVIKYEEEETVYYNPKTFYRDEDIIIFPFKEFDSFYNELVQNLNVVKDVIDDALNSNSPHPPLTDLERIEDWINSISEDVDLLLKFKMQSTLEFFQRVNSARIKHRNPSLQKPKVFERFPQPPQKPSKTVVFGAAKHSLRKTKFFVPSKQNVSWPRILRIRGLRNSTNFESFVRTPQIGNKLPLYPKEEIQCLIGL